MTSSSGLHAIHACKSFCWRKLRTCCARGDVLPLKADAFIVPSHDAKLLKRFHRAASFFNSFADELFAASLFESSREYFRFRFRRNQQDAIEIAKQNVPGPDAHRSDLDRYTKVDYFVSRSGVLPVRTETE